ncbi:MAG: sensor histidine kinase, partial [Pirellulales bacterium]|nr:sensor histidine kinase [Pirellulales bacterium]
SGNKFTDEHLKLMIAIAHQAALAVEDTRYYSAMVQAERLAAVGQTIATLSHHIKNILQGIRGGSYLIEHGLSHHDEAVIRKGWDIVEKNQNKISTLVLDMLTFSKEREPELAPADINEVVTDVVELMTTRAGELDVDLTCAPQADIPRLSFDADGLHRAVLNLVTNALDAAGECDDRRGQVHVTTDYQPGTGLVRVVVEDNGGGIPPEDREAIFSLFVSRKGGRGTGLGLPVTAKIVREHGGRVLVDSEVGRGSRFTIEMPAVLATSATAH